MFGERFDNRHGRKGATRPLYIMALTICSSCASAPPPSPQDVADANDTGRALDAASEGERQLLRQLPKLRAGTSQQIGEDLVVADAAYAAASGRAGRALLLTAGKTGKVSHRVACTTGGTWFFVPDVFGGDIEN